MGEFQDQVAESCTDYFNRFRRQTHVTPKSYLSFLGGYKKIYSEKKKEIGTLAERMNTGLKKLIEATESVNQLSKELLVKEKDLAIANIKAEEVLKSVTVQQQGFFFFLEVLIIECFFHYFFNKRCRKGKTTSTKSKGQSSKDCR